MNLNTIYHSDAFELMSQIPYGSVHAIITDMPYGTTQNKWDSVVDLGLWWQHAKRVCSGPVVMTASQPFTSALGASNLDGLRYAWVWEKASATGHLNAKRMPMKLHEDVLVFCDLPHTYNPQGLQPLGKMVRRGHNGGNFGKSGVENFQEWTNYPRSIVRFASDPKSTHPTQKPVALMAYLIATYTNPGDTVLDPFCGSGTTCLAAEQLGRKWIGGDSSDEYCRIARKRIVDYALEREGLNEL